MQNKSNSPLLSNAKKLLSSGDLGATIAFLKEALAKQPDFYDGWLLLSKCLFDAGYFKEAMTVGQNAERFDPLNSDFQSIQLYMQKNALKQAQQTAKQMLSEHPGHPRGIFTLAHIASRSNQEDTSIELLKQGLHYSPANLMLRQMLISSQESMGDYQGAISSAQTLVSIADSFDSLWVLITLLLKYGQHNQLLGLCQQAKAKSNGDKIKLSKIELVKGQTLRVIGRREDSISAFRASLQSDSKNAEAYWALADMKNFAFSKEDSSAIQLLLETPNLSQGTKCIATFALAKASESSGNWEATMHLYHDANRLKNVKQFNPVHVENEFKVRMQSFSQQTLAIQADEVATETTPIFIVGLPRSGSTLVEQILASHSQIEGTIEQPTLPSIEKKAQAFCARHFRKDLFSSIGNLTPAVLSELGLAYLKNGQIFRHNKKPFFIDKLPFNFRHIGLIHKILPKAVIIDVRRNPLDNGFSLYKQYFPSGVDFSYNLSHIGAFYNAYQNIMDFWQRSLPSKILHLQYEELIHSPEQQIRRLLAHVGVAFEPACLNFHSTERTVHTASSEQVRQPINTKGIGAWCKAEPSLSLLVDSLGLGTLERNQKYIDMG